MNVVDANPSTAQSSTALVTAVAGKLVKIRSIFISSDTAMTVTLENSVTNATLLLRLYVTNNGGLALGPKDIDESMWTIDAEGIDYSTSAAGNVYIRVGYELT